MGGTQTESVAESESEKKRRVEDLWLRKLRHADERFRLASAQYRETHADYGSRSSHSAAEASELRKALQRERLAKAEYIRVLRTFTRLVLRGEIPPEASNDKTA